MWTSQYFFLVDRILSTLYSQSHQDIRVPFLQSRDIAWPPFTLRCGHPEISDTSDLMSAKGKKRVEKNIPIQTLNDTHYRYWWINYPKAPWSCPHTSHPITMPGTQYCSINFLIEWENTFEYRHYRIVIPCDLLTFI